MKTPLGSLLDKMENHDGGVSAALITNPEDVECYSGFRGKGAALFVHSLVSYLILGPCEVQQCTEYRSKVKVITASWEEAVNLLSELCSKLGIHSIWIEEGHINKEEYKMLKQSLNGVELIPGDEFIACKTTF